MSVVKRCSICARFASYEERDAYCVACGNEGLADACECGRSFDYALDARGDLYCPRCGRSLRGRAPEFTE
ncbi:MAG: hypothetical protein NVS1B4_24880 [Gemmatimonadaceae bacterium]